MSIKDKTEEELAIEHFVATGHTEHCAQRLVHGDGSCECGQTDGKNCDDCGEFVPKGWMHGCD